MSDRPKFAVAEAMVVALELQELLAPLCERVEIAGSIRRRRPLVGDVELLFIPRTGERSAGLFDTETVSLAEELLNGMVADGRLAKRPSVTGAFTWGPENKLGIHVASGIPVDFFSTSPDRWWNALVVRTGGKQNNLAITTTAQRQGWRFEAYGSGFRNLTTGEHHATTSERDVFEFMGLPYLQPHQRL
jgi:DNA polymerase/3'-5' exonuclease PolX